MSEQQQEFSTIALPMNVQDAMRDNLPQMVNKVLREELLKGAEAIEKVASLNLKIKEITEALDAHTKLSLREKAVLKAEEQAAQVKEMLREKVLEQESARLRDQLEHERTYSLRLEGALAGLVRNTEWRESVSKDLRSEFNSNTGGYSYTEQGRTTVKEEV